MSFDSFTHPKREELRKREHINNRTRWGACNRTDSRKKDRIEKDRERERKKNSDLI